MSMMYQEYDPKYHQCEAQNYQASFLLAQKNVKPLRSIREYFFLKTIKESIRATDRKVDRDQVYCDHRGNRSSSPKVIAPEVMSPETRVMSPEIYSYVARNDFGRSDLRPDDFRAT